MAVKPCGLMKPCHLVTPVSATRLPGRYRSHQQGLPTLPVPPLQQTLERYVTALEPIVEAEELRRTRGLVQDFQRAGGLGERLQGALENRAKNTENWVSGRRPRWTDWPQRGLRKKHDGRLHRDSDASRTWVLRGGEPDGLGCTAGVDLNGMFCSSTRSCPSGGCRWPTWTTGCPWWSTPVPAWCSRT